MLIAHFPCTSQMLLDVEQFGGFSFRGGRVPAKSEGSSYIAHPLFINRSLLILGRQMARVHVHNPSSGAPSRSAAKDSAVRTAPMTGIVIALPAILFTSAFVIGATIKV